MAKTHEAQARGKAGKGTSTLVEEVRSALYPEDWDASELGLPYVLVSVPWGLDEEGQPIVHEFVCSVVLYENSKRWKPANLLTAIGNAVRSGDASIKEKIAGYFQQAQADLLFTDIHPDVVSNTDGVDLDIDGAQQERIASNSQTSEKKRLTRDRSKELASQLRAKLGVTK